MRQCIVNYLLVFLVVGAVCPDTFAREISLFDAFSDETEVDNPETIIDSGNSLLMNNELEDDIPKKSTKKKTMRKFLRVDLERSRRGLTLEQGQSYELTCTVDGNPRANVYWIRGENSEERIYELLKASVPLNLSDLDVTNVGRIKSKYVIDCASKKDQGPIYCVAIADDRMSHQSTMITVDDSKKSTRMCNPNRSPVITNYLWGVLSEIGSTVVLPCKAEGTPRPKTRWIDISGREIVNYHYNDRYKILGNGELMIENLEWNDMGGLTCEAESIFGVDRIETFVYPLEH